MPTPLFKVLGLAAALALLGPVAAAGQDDAFQTQITIGRLPVLTFRASEVLEGLKAARAPEETDAATLYRSLYFAWLDLERLRADACAAGVLTGQACEGRFEPAWLRPPGSFAPSLEEVTAWADALQGEVLAVTDPICDQAPPDPEGPGACSVE